MRYKIDLWFVVLSMVFIDFYIFNKKKRKSEKQKDVLFFFSSFHIGILIRKNSFFGKVHFSNYREYKFSLFYSNQKTQPAGSWHSSTKFIFNYGACS